MSTGFSNGSVAKHIAQYAVHWEYEMGAGGGFNPRNTPAYEKKTIKTILCGLSPQANYTDRATAAVGEVVRLLRVEGVTWSAQRIPTAVNLGFLDRSRYFFFQIAPQL
jgi:hypothetical protein